MKITKKAFTMAEVLMVLAVLGIIAAILIPAIATLKPDQNRVMFKKAYYLTERLIAEIVNDEQLYPSSNVVGFPNMNVAKLVKSDGTGEDDMKVEDRGTSTIVGDNTAGSAAQGNKLCLLFQDRLNLITDTNGTTGCGGTTNTFGGNPNFKTVDGMWWYFPSGSSATTSTGGRWQYTPSVAPTVANGGWKVIRVDTNGDKKPNCRCKSVTGGNGSNKDACNSFEYWSATTVPTSCKKPDGFEIWVRYDGKMSVGGPSGTTGNPGPKEVEYLRAATTVSDK